MGTNCYDGSIMILDLTLLQTFVRIVEAGGFTAAGEELNMAQSTVSAHLARLEEAVGHRLLRRDSHTITLTEKGERLLGHARTMLRQNQLLRDDLNEESIEGHVRLGIPDDYVGFLPESLGEFEARYPAVRMEVHCGLSVDLLTAVRSGVLDLAVVTRQPNSPGGKVLRREPLVWAGTLEHRVSERDPLPLALSRKGVCIFREQAISALEAAGIRWRIAYTGSSLSGITAAVRAGLAITVVTPSMLDAGLHDLSAHAELPPLGNVEIAIHLAARRPREPVQELYATIERRLGSF